MAGKSKGKQTQNKSEYKWVDELSHENALQLIKDMLAKEAWQNDSIANLEQSLAHATSAANNSSQSIVTLVANNDRLAQMNFALQEELKQLRETQEKPNNTETYGKPPDFSFAMIKAIQDADKMKSKAERAVIEFMPEEESEAITSAKDHELISQITREMKIEQALQTSDVKRHGPKRDSRPRIIKDIVLLKDQDKEVALNNRMEQWQQISSVDSSQKQIITKLFIVISEGIVCYETIDHHVYEYAPLRDYLAILRESVLSTNGCEVVIQFYACDTYIPYKYRKTSEQPKQEFTSMEQLKTFAQHLHSIAFLWAGDTVTAHFGPFKKKRNKMPCQLDYCSELFSRERSILKCKKLDVTLVDNWPLSIVTNVVDRCDECELQLEEMLPENCELHDAFLEEIYERDLIQKVAVTLCIPDVETVNDFIDKLEKRFRSAPQKCFKFELFAYSKQVDKLSLKTQDCILKARTSILHNYLESVIIEQSAIGS
ncbi:hypothetical protein Ddc_20517 [Ditylenchus destructor]|nr:hypothetical protein Ddc_20517 [Ditylenchus destructor]